MSRDWHGISRSYRRGDERAHTLAALARHGGPLELDPNGARAAWGELDDDEATIVLGVRRSPRVTASFEPLAYAPWIETFERAVSAIVRDAAEPVLALGGGLDAAAVLVAWRRHGAPMPPVVTLRTGLAGYDEHEAAIATARALGVTCEVIDVASDALVRRAPDAAVHAETPFYDLHPVHRLLLAEACGPRATLVTGDGADAVFAQRADLDYVPYVVALARAAGVAVESPFFDPALVRGTPRDPSKSHLRRYLRAHGLERLADAPKRARSVPPLPLDPIVDRERVAALSSRLGLPLEWSRARARVGWATLDHLVRALEAR